MTFITPCGDVYRIDVGRATKKEFPVSRELQAVDDTSDATGEGGDFVAYGFEP